MRRRFNSKPRRCRACARDARRASFERQSIGYLGELHPRLVKALSLSNTLYLFELEITSAFADKPRNYNRFQGFPVCGEIWLSW